MMKKTLKTMALLLLVAISATFTSCSKPDDETNEGNGNGYYWSEQYDQIIGKWKCVQSSESELTNLDVGDVFEFKSGGVLIWNNFGTTYHISDDILVIGGGGAQLTWRISELNNNSLKLRMKLVMADGGVLSASSAFSKIE